MNEKICVLGLGYVGLPLALAFAGKFKDVVGFDVNVKKIEQLKAGKDVTDEGFDTELRKSTLKITSNLEDIKGCTVFIVSVPTPVDENKSPDLIPVKSACRSVAAVIQKGALIIFESTVYPGVTEEVCGPLIEELSGLKSGKDFFLGYSPERINPGDKEHTLQSIIKVVAGQDANSLERVAAVYSAVVDAGVYKATSIKVAEAAKVIENTQRDLNIALMNELAIIFERMDIRTKDVLDAASTKWNFLRFNPGLVGGHCIGVDPYYLTAKAAQLGYHPQVILAGRKINDGMGKYVADKTIKMMIQQGIAVHSAKVGVLGLTFKENVTDIRNSRVPDVVNELREFGLNPIIHDPHANPEEFLHEYNLELSDYESLEGLDALIYAVPHRWYRDQAAGSIRAKIKSSGILVDIKSAWPGSKDGLTYWSL